MSRCPICNSPKRVLKSTFSSDVGSAEVYSVISLGCLNDAHPIEPCPSYAGGENPDPELIEIVRNKVGG